MYSTSAGLPFLAATRISALKLAPIAMLLWSYCRASPGSHWGLASVSSSTVGGLLSRCGCLLDVQSGCNTSDSLVSSPSRGHIDYSQPRASHAVRMPPCSEEEAQDMHSWPPRVNHPYTYNRLPDVDRVPHP
jgi:hypothetical protein